jgi:thiol:disulfide interchange protein
MRPRTCSNIVILCTALMAVLPSLARAQATQRASVRATLNYTALQPGQQAVIAVVLGVKTKFHAQSHTPLDPNLIAFDVSFDANPQVEFFTPIFPAPVIETYPGLGKVSVYTGRAITYVPVQVKRDAAPGPIALNGTVTYQICDDRACFNPEMPTIKIETRIAAPGETVSANEPELFSGFDPSVFSNLLSPTTAPAAATEKAAASFTVFGHSVAANSYVVVYSLALLVGIIFNVMPCVLPVLPLKALGFYEASQHHRSKSFVLGVFFSAGIVFTFAILAVLILFGGQNWGELFSYGWFVWGITAILILFALAMFGSFTLRLPLGVYSFEPRHDTYSGNFLFGILTAVLSTPCTAPVFPALLAWAAAQKRAMGVGMLLMVGVGMALPYLILSAFPELARKIPRTGRWSELIKQAMGFVILGVAGYFAGQRLFSGFGYLWILLPITLAAGVFIVMRIASIAPRFWPIAISSVLALLLVGGTLWGAVVLNRKGLWTYYTTDNFAAARESGRPVLVKFTANWCLNCQYVERTVYPDPRTIAALKQYGVITLKADLTTRDAPGWPLLKQLSPSGGIPFTAIWPPGKDQPIELASIYTTDDLLHALESMQKTTGPAHSDASQGRSHQPSDPTAPPTADASRLLARRQPAH